MASNSDNMESARPLSQETREKTHFEMHLVWRVIGMCCGSVSFGFAAAIIATTLGQPSFQNYMNLTATNPSTPHIEGAMNSLFYAGGFFGSIFNSWFCDAYGRKMSIMTASGILIVSCALCAGSINPAMFIVFRFCTGWGCLMLLSSVPLLITEVVPPKGRGMLANIHGVGTTTGYLLATYVGIGFFYDQGATGNQWRGPLALACLFPILTICLMPWIPESPRWLLSKGHVDRAWKIVEEFHHTSHDFNSSYARAEFLQMQQQVEMDSTLDSSWRILVTRPSYRKRALIACAVLTFLYSSGTLTVSNYGPELFAGLGYSAASTLEFQGGIIWVSIVGTLISFFFVDRIRRNVYIGTGLAFVIIPLAGEAAMDACFVGTDNASGLAAGVAFLYIYIFLYAVFLEGPGYFYASEIFPNHLRSKGATLCIACYSLINIMWTQVSPIAFASIGWKFYLVFIACCVVSSATVFLTFPDTLNKPLEDIARLFGDEDLVALYSSDVVVDSEKDDAFVVEAKH